MFTGIIQDIGVVAAHRQSGENIVFTIESRLVDPELGIGDSVSISGVCLTVTEISVPEQRFCVAAVQETLKRTSLSRLRQGARINLELALRPTDRLGGHFVQGHVDTIGRCERITELSGSRVLIVSFDREYRGLVVEKGSIAIDGVSLTAYGVTDREFAVSFIPHTLKATTLDSLKIGDELNLEFDILGKYVARMQQTADNKKLSIQMLRDFGY